MRQTFLTFFLIILILATAVVWYTYVRQPPSETGAVEDSGAGTPATLENERIAQYNELKNLKPDTSVLSDALFQSLVRYRSSNQPPRGEPGRANPFAPF